LESAGGEIGGRAETGEALVAALEKAGIQFITENGGRGAGVRLAKRGKENKIEGKQPCQMIRSK
jgi:hypothetical protein